MGGGSAPVLLSGWKANGMELVTKCGEGLVFGGGMSGSLLVK